MKIKVLGTGCAKCHQVERTTREVIQELGIDATIEEVKEMSRILEYPILTTPGLVVDEEVVCSGRVPTKAEVTKFITNALARDESAGSSE